MLPALVINSSSKYSASGYKKKVAKSYQSNIKGIHMCYNRKPENLGLLGFASD